MFAASLITMNCFLIAGAALNHAIYVVVNILKISPCAGAEYASDGA